MKFQKFQSKMSLRIFSDKVHSFQVIGLTLKYLRKKKKIKSVYKKPPKIPKYIGRAEKSFFFQFYSILFRNYF